ncbi:MAG: sulfur carrier protein ThiS [Gemmatimonadota bacterium]
MTELDLTINGEPRRIAGPATVADMLTELGLDPRTVVVEVNRAIIRRGSVTEVTLRNGDAVELVHFVGGG